MDVIHADSAIYPGVSQYTGRHWLKWAMRKSYKVDYIHAWIGFRLEGVPMVYHSTGRGVHLQGWDAFLEAGRIVKHQWRVPLTGAAFRQFVREALRESGGSPSNHWQVSGSGDTPRLP